MHLKETEIDFINGYIIARGEELGIKCVMNFLIQQLVAGKTFREAPTGPKRYPIRVKSKAIQALEPSATEKGLRPRSSSGRAKRALRTVEVRNARGIEPENPNLKWTQGKLVRLSENEGISKSEEPEGEVKEEIKGTDGSREEVGNEPSRKSLNDVAAPRRLRMSERKHTGSRAFSWSHLPRRRLGSKGARRNA